MDNTFLGVTHSHNPSGLMAVFADGVEVLVWRAHTAPNKRDFLGDYFIAEHPTYRTPDYWGDFSTEIVERRAHHCPSERHGMDGSGMLWHGSLCR